MNFIRSVLYALALLIITPPFTFLSFLSFPFAIHTRYYIITRWTRIMLWFVRNLLGIRHCALGVENITSDACVVLSKHQSAWETMALQLYLPGISFVIKRELQFVPFFGWGLACLPVIAIDRSSGSTAKEQMVRQGTERMKQGFWVVVFPEGTRIPIGQKKRYKDGGAILACTSGRPVLPVAHNAGEFWPRNAFVKRTGEITISFGPPISSQGKTAEALNAEVETWIEGEMHRLFPHHYQ